jgi:hypothetical protein
MIPLIVCPIARAENAERVAHLWAQQTRVSELLYAPAKGISITGLTCRPTATIGEARNVGLEIARMNGHSCVIFWDDDNYYGPSYVEDTIDAFTRGAPAVVSRGIGFVRHEDGLWWYDDAKTPFYPGHCTAVDPQRAAIFPAASFAEDVEWSRRMAGQHAVRLGPWGLVYDRVNPATHAYNAEREVFLRQHGPARFLGQRPDMIVDIPFETTAHLTCASDADIFAAMRRARPCY